MGMAAAQARLLSITTRLSDNELRAQIINNDKMRLATESSQVSENYITALNEAQYMFSNYDKDSNVSYKKLTYNALTSYNAYNNQYALLNSSGQIIVSERDAVNFVNSKGDLTTFLKFYNLEEKTSYFDENTNVLNINNDGNVTYTYFGNTIEENQNSGFTKEQLKAIFMGTTDENMINSIKSSLLGTDKGNLQLDGYYNVESSQLMYNYTKALNKYLISQEDYQLLIKSSMMEEVDKKIANKCKNDASNKYYPSFDLNKGPESLSNLLSEIDKVEDIDKMSKVMQHISNVIDLVKGISGYKSNSLDNIQTYLNNNSNATIEEKYQAQADDSDPNKILIFRYMDENGNYKYNKNAYMQLSGSNYVISEIVKDDKGNESTEEYIQLKRQSNGEYKSDPVENDNTTYIYNPTTNDFTIQTKNNLQNMKKIAKNVLDYMSSNLVDTILDSTDDHWKTNDKIKAAYNEYENAAIALGRIIFGKNYNGSSPDITKLDDISNLYNNLNTGGNPNNFNIAPDTIQIDGVDVEIDNFYPIYLNILMDNIMNTYGEPKFAWTDTENVNENGEAKYNWYKNLFSKMQNTGYTILKDGLASSTDWMRYAFESGIVTMEQFDKDETWNPLIYTNCSDITTQTDDVAVAKAEAEYKAAMNKIENKDKRYDLELKNIDTEHNSLQTEYDTIKATLDKHIERTFKLYS